MIIDEIGRNERQQSTIEIVDKDMNKKRLCLREKCIPTE
jgi:hypothetical protein